MTTLLAVMTATTTVEISGWKIAAATIAILLTVAGVELGVAWLVRADRETGRVLQDRD